MHFERSSFISLKYVLLIFLSEKDRADGGQTNVHAPQPMQSFSLNSGFPLKFFEI